MASLTHTAYLSRLLIKFGGLFIVVFVIMWSLLVAGYKAYLAAHPPYTPPTMKWGALPKIVFPEKQFDKKSFTLELPNDSFPKYGDQAKVYFIYRPENRFTALEQDKVTAKSMGFSSNPSEIRTGVYEFKNDNLNQTLTMNVLEGSFRLSYPYKEDQMLLNPKAMPNKEAAITIAKNYLNGAKKLQGDLEEGDKKVSFWKIEYDGLKAALSQSEANIARVDFFRKNLEGDFKILGASLDRASISVLVSGADVESKKVVEVDYKYSNFDRESFSTYYIKSPQDAWTDLKNGNYWPATDSAGNSLVIRQVELAYFEPVTLTNFLQPIYVFKGDGNFVAYVTAIPDKYLK